MKQNQVGFKSSLLGFKKTDVLNWIDEQSSQILEKEEQSKKAQNILQMQLDDLLAQKDVNEESLLQKKAEIALLEKTVEEQKINFEQKESELNKLVEELQISKETAKDFRNRLFEREEDAVLLRKNNDQLTQQLHQKQLEVEKSFETVEKIKSDAEEEIKRERQLSKFENIKTKESMRESASAMVCDLDLIKSDLTSLEQHILDSMLQMQQSTSVLSETLKKTEENIQKLGVKLQDFPTQPSVEQVEQKQQNASHVRNANSSKVHQKRQQSKKVGSQQTLSRFLLNQISKLLDE